MKKIAYILIFVLSFLFLHSELGLIKKCANQHADHNVREIIQNSEVARFSTNKTNYHFDYNVLMAILKVIPIKEYCFETNQNLSYFDFYPHRFKPKKLIHFLSSLLI